MSLSLGVLHTRLIPISFGYPYVSRQLVALACPQRGRASSLLSLVDARLSGVVSLSARAAAALSSLEDPSELDAGFLGRADGARRHRHVWHRAHPPHARGSQPAADRPQRRVKSSLDWRGQTLPATEPIRLGRGVGLCHGHCRRKKPPIIPLYRHQSRILLLA